MWWLWENLRDRAPPKTTTGKIKDFSIRLGKLCLVSPLLPYGLYRHHQKKQLEKFARERAERYQRDKEQRDLVQPTLLARSYNAALGAQHPESSNTVPDETAISEQTQSGFVKLPPEVRRMIYIEALGNARLHVLLEAQKITHAKCSLSRCRWCVLPRFHHLTPNTSSRMALNKRDKNDCSDCSLLSLLTVCRQVYLEAREIPFMYNTFDFQYLDVFLRFTLKISPESLDLIRSIRLGTAFYDNFHNPQSWHQGLEWSAIGAKTWQRSWEVIAGMQHLRSVNLEVWHSTRMDVAFEKAVLEPLNAIKVPEFRVVLMWPGDFLGEGSYELERLPMLEQSMFLEDDIVFCTLTEPRGRSRLSRLW